MSWGGRAPAPQVRVRQARQEDRDVWDACAVRDAGNATQSWGHGEFAAAGGWPVERLMAIDTGGTVAGVMQLVFRQIGTVSVGYSPRGPALATGRGDDVVGALVHVARARARARRSVRLHLDPMWPADDTAVRHRIRSAALHPAGAQHMHQCTWVVDLHGGSDAVLQRIGGSVRRHIRTAARNGVSVAASSNTDTLEQFHRLHVATCSRKNLTPPTLDDLNMLVTSWAMSMPVAVLLACVAGEPVRGMIVVAAGPRLCFMFGGGLETSGELQPAYAMHWAAMLWGLDNGCTVYDMWGVPCPDAQQPKDGYGHFKQRWRGELQRSVPCLSASPWPLPPRTLAWLERRLLRGRPLLRP